MSAWFASTAVGRLWEHTVSWCQGQKLIRELSQMPRDETERILHDVGLSMSDMPALTHPHAGPTVLLPQRLELLGLDPAYFEKTQPGTMGTVPALVGNR